MPYLTDACRSPKGSTAPPTINTKPTMSNRYILTTEGRGSGSDFDEFEEFDDRSGILDLNTTAIQRINVGQTRYTCRLTVNLGMQLIRHSLTT